MNEKTNNPEIQLEESYHWYILTFLYTNSLSTTYVDKTFNTSIKRITDNDIIKIKKELDIPHNSVTINASYLGYMTNKEFYCE